MCWPCLCAAALSSTSTAADAAVIYANATTAVAISSTAMSAYGQVSRPPGENEFIISPTFQFQEDGI